MPLTIGLIREGKTPPDKRVPLTPKKCVEALGQTFPGCTMVVQSSAIRITAYFFIRVVAGDDWFPFRGHHLPVAVAGVNTAILLSSSLTMHWAQTSVKNGNRLGLKAGMLTTFLLGSTFLFIQINEYVNIGFAPHDFAQGSIFYGLTGLHGAHVFIGLTLLAMVTVRAFRGHFTPEEHRGVEVPGIYWHFVDIMWVIVYTTIYII